MDAEINSYHDDFHEVRQSAARMALAANSSDQRN
jgi:hypothetical protein